MRAAPRPVQRAAPPRPAQQAAPRQTLPAAPPPAAVGQPAASQGPGLMAQMAATAGGVAIGSAVGHTIGHALTGGGGSAAAQEAVAPVQQESSYGQQQQRPIGGGMCEQEFQQFIRCTQEQSDISLCSGYNELLKECKFRNNAI